jgi:hypothetical protein
VDAFNVENAPRCILVPPYIYIYIYSAPARKLNEDPINHCFCVGMSIYSFYL